MAELRPKVSIIGGGHVGMRYAYALIMRELARQIVMVDINREKLEGDVMDLSHGAPYVSPVEITAGDYPDIAGSDLVVITAGKSQAPGQTRLDLAKANVELFRKMIPEIAKHAPSALYLVATNPVDILSYAAYKFSSKPWNEVIGSGTVLDTARFRFLLGKHCNVDPHNIHAYILGEHGDTEFPVWSKALIGGILYKDYCPLCKNSDQCNREEGRKKIFEEVRDSAYQIIRKKGETSYGIGLALVRITRAILNNENSILPVSSLVQDYLGVNDLYLSLPSIVCSEGVRDVLDIRLDEKEENDFRRSADAVRSVLQATGLISKVNA